MLWNGAVVAWLPGNRNWDIGCNCWRSLARQEMQTLLVGFCVARKLPGRLRWRREDIVVSGVTSITRYFIS